MLDHDEHADNLGEHNLPCGPGRSGGGPQGLPRLGRGPHHDPHHGACLMEYTSLLAGLEFSDHPECTDPGLAVLARIINDTVSDSARAGLALLAPALIDTTVTRPRPGPRRLGRGLRWIARQLRGAIAHAAAVHTALALSLAGHHLANHRDTALVALLDRATRAHRHRHRLPKIDSRPLHLGQPGRLAPSCPDHPRPQKTS
jgi:hypothetical protein